MFLEGILRFYGHFAAAYGTFWFATFAYAFLAQRHIELDGLWIWGFPT